MKSSMPLGVYIALAYLTSWLVFVLLALNHHQIIFLFPDDAAHGRLQDLWHALGALGPLLGALGTLRLYHTPKQRRQFFAGYAAHKLTTKGWLLALSPIFLLGLSLLVSRITEHHWVDVPGFFSRNQLTHPLNLLAWLLPVLFYGFGEEAGWRGYALPVLQSRYSAFKATMILYIIWAIWHIPSFFYRYELTGAAFGGFLLGLFAGATWLTFLFNYTKGSILAASLWHVTFNAVSMIAKDEVILSAVLSTTVLLLAAFVLIRYKSEDLSPVKKTGLQTEKITRSALASAGISKTRVVTKLEEKRE